MLKLIMETQIDGEISVAMFRTHFGYAVRYGLQVKSNMRLSDATEEYRNCLSHALGCAGEFDDDAFGDEVAA